MDIELRYTHDEDFTDMVMELLDYEEAIDFFNLTTYERKLLRQYVEERMEL